MTDAGEPKPWIRAKIEALLRAEWLGKAGAFFRQTAETIETFNDEHVHIWLWHSKVAHFGSLFWPTLG
jgi:transposase InsO family protein